MAVNPNTTILENNLSIDWEGNEKNEGQSFVGLVEIKGSNGYLEVNQDFNLAELSRGYINDNKGLHSNRSIAVNSNTQEFYNKNNQRKFEEMMYSKDGELNKDFKKNLAIFHLIYNLVFAIKFFVVLAGYFDKGTSFTYMIVNVISLAVLVLIVQVFIVLYIKFFERGKENFKVLYGFMMALSICYFGIMDPMTMEHITNSTNLELYELQGSLYILTLIILTKDLFYNNTKLIFTLGVFGATITIIMYIVNNQIYILKFLSNFLITFLNIIILVLNSFRYDFQQKYNFIEIESQNNLAEKLKNLKIKIEEKQGTQREQMIAKCNLLHFIFEDLKFQVISKELKNELPESIKQLNQIKEFLINLPILPNFQMPVMFKPIESVISAEQSLEVQEYSKPDTSKLMLSSLIEEDIKHNFIVNWNFDVFKLRYSNLFASITRFTLSHLKIDITQLVNLEKLFCFLDTAESTYFNNPYHNRYHAIDVLHSFLYILKSRDLFERLNSLDWICSIVSALGHDIAHQGKDNLYLKQTEDDLCRIYNDHMVLENMHCAKIFELLKSADCSFHEPMKKDEKKLFRENIIYLVLGTDFSTFIETAGKLNCFITEKNNKDFFKLNPNEPFILSVALKCADIGHFAKDFLLYEKWNSLLLKEYMALPDNNDYFIKNREEEFCLNNKRFIDLVVYPLYSSWIKYLTIQSGKELPLYIAHIKENLGGQTSKRFNQSTSEINK